MESRRRQSSPPHKLARFSDSGRASGFTIMQLQELEQQSLIFHHIAAGVPVPLHLVLPIWRSVAASSPSFLRRSFPSFMGCAGFDCSSVDSEPGRCRRTDGKKWRCSKNVVPDQKYCERHIHRGRRRVRKVAGESSPAVESSLSGRGGLGSSPISVLPDCSEDGSS